ncbi:conserved hypothetical protein [Vibrio jasicida]|uniref:Uncharacterized protein n=2 Tax=Vibrio jasicida TaxID=766224 RepID=A0AAU9QUH9_9VIBR|nr:conserved hypothetical protein [Vibrio jasicida]CAH1599424.1 conserved hypothetical protein [Vibrio jasicida]
MLDFIHSFVTENVTTYKLGLYMSNKINAQNAAGRFARLVVAVAIFFASLLFVPIITSPIYNLIGSNNIGVQGTLDFVIVCAIVFIFAIYPFFIDVKRRLNSKNNQNDTSNQ